MKRALFLKPLTLSSICLLVACAGQQSKPNIGDQACWLEQPITEERVGQFGLARDLYIGGDTPITKSRKRAVASLADYLAVSQDIESVLENVNDKVDSVSLNGKTLYFSGEFSLDGYAYSYATLEKTEPSKQCSTQSCNISACQPSWLCTPSKGDQVAMLGVSYQATSPLEQHYKSIENALMQAEYMYGVDIVAQKNLRQTNSDYFRYNVFQQDGDVSTGTQEALSYAVTDRCSSQGNLYSRVALYGDIRQSKAKPVTNNAWLKDPKHLGYDGAIGSVQKPVASGLISDQIKLAIKRAAIQLAFEKQSDVSEDSVIIQRGDNSTLLISHINENTNVKLHAKVLSIHFKESEGGQLEVFTWLARIN